MAKGDIYFDGDKALKALQQELLTAANDCMDYILNEIKGGMSFSVGSADVDDGLITQLRDIISAEVVSGAYAIMDSYGTGNKMDKTNPALNDYMGGGLWNPARQGYSIVGRPKGKYTGILGDRVSAGTREGMPIGGGIEPSFAIQWAEDKMREPNGYVQRRIFFAVDSVFGEGRGSRFFGNR